MTTTNRYYIFAGFSIPETCKSIYEGIFQKPLETVKLIVPAALYVVQNSLLFVALSNLDSATYQVNYFNKATFTNKCVYNFYL